MDPLLNSRVLSLDNITDRNKADVGSKTARLASLLKQGYRVPRGFCLTAACYRYFIESNGLDSVIRVETGRKPFRDMRWEEIWDSALRIRSSFLAAPIPPIIQQEMKSVFLNMGLRYPLAARSSGIREDSGKTSFAGLHESFINIPKWDELLRSVRLVWASLWSDAALLYQKELRLDPASSEMAVLIQEMAPGKVSGVAFGKDPREKIARHEVVESVPGNCSFLVSGEIDPDRWILKRKNGNIVRWDAGRRPQKARSPLLKKGDLSNLHRTMRRLHKHYRWEADMEWTGHAKEFTILQVRPVTSKVSKRQNKRSWYLSLRVPNGKLKRLRERVVGVLIPKLKDQGDAFSQELLEECSPRELARSLRERYQALRGWKKIYQTEFIPFAHGVRAFGIYYNDIMKPSDPYEFVRLLEGEIFLTTKRQRVIEGLAALLRKSSELSRAVRKWLGRGGAEVPGQLSKFPESNVFLKKLKVFQNTHADVSYKGKRLSDSVGWILGEILAFEKSRKIHRATSQRKSFEKTFFKKVGRKRKKEAHDILDTARLSWRLRDDDNLLVARIESQLLRALDLASKILRAQGKLKGGSLSEENTIRVIQLLEGRRKDFLNIERRGGMLIHGAIIARELGVPCVNGIPEAAEKICQGDLLTVDGHLGIVTIGKPEFDIENRI